MKYMRFTYNGGNFTSLRGRNIQEVLKINDTYKIIRYASDSYVVLDSNENESVLGVITKAELIQCFIVKPIEETISRRKNIISKL